MTAAAGTRRPQTRYRDATTATILAEREAWRWDLAELDADPGDWAFAEQSRAVIAAAIEDADAELARREALRRQPSAPPWPTQPPDRRAELDEIKRRLPLAEFIERHAPVNFERQGKELVCNCPLPGHDDGTPSFHVNPNKNLWHCFGCGRGGDVFEFARHNLGIGEFTAVADVLRVWAGLPTPPHRPAPSRQRGRPPAGPRERTVRVA